MIYQIYVYNFMELSGQDRGNLDHLIDMQKEEVVQKWKVFKSTKENFMWYIRGVVEGIFTTVFYQLNGRPFKEKEWNEVQIVVATRMNEISDLIADLPNH